MPAAEPARVPLNPRGLPVATMTLARNAEEDALLRRGLAVLAAHGMRVAVADGGSAPAFVDAVRALPTVTMCPPAEPGLVAQVGASIATAATWGSSFVLYTEPDKETFFREHLAGFLQRADRADDVGIVVAGRSAEAFATFPAAQRQAETFANFLCADATGVRGDYFYGPFLFRTRLASLVAGLPRTIGWGWRPYLFAAAARRGYRTVVVEGDFRCPEDQRVETDTDRDHRLRQLGQNISGLSLAMRMV